MEFRPVPIVHCRTHVALVPVARNHVHMCMMRLCRFPVIRPKNQRYYELAIRENYTFVLHKWKEIDTN